jgi:thiol-disulfide isomerase/thioredoxin
MIGKRLRSVALALLAAGTLVTACNSGGAAQPSPAESDDTAIPFSECPVKLDGQTAPPPPANAKMVPDLTLPCFGGDTQVALRDLAKPAVVNLWASWCGPCRQELPAINEVFQAAGDRLAFVGVVTEDTKPAAASLAEDLEITFPATFDPGGKLHKALGTNALPITLFVTASGELAYTYIGPALTTAKLQELIKTYLGVTVEL